MHRNNTIFWLGCKFQTHNNIRYLELFPRLSNLTIIQTKISSARIIGVIQHKLVITILHPIMCILLGFIYDMMFCTDASYIRYFKGKIIVDLDDPKYTEFEKANLNKANVSLIIVTTNQIKAKLESCGITRPIEIIGQGVDLVKVNIKKRSDCRRELNVKGFIVGLSQPSFYLMDGNDKLTLPPEYDITFLSQVMNIVWKKDPDIHLWLLGQGDTTIRTWANGKNVKLIGYVPHEQLFKYIKCFDVAVYPRLVNFNGRFSIKILEYLACGVPVITTNVGEAFIISPRKNGYVTSDKNKFAEYILKLNEDKKLKKYFSKNAIKSGLKFDWNMLSRTYNYLINKYCIYE